MNHAIIAIILTVCLFTEDALRKSKPQIAARLLAFSGLITIVEIVLFALNSALVLAVLYAIILVMIVSRFPWRLTMSKQGRKDQ